MNRALKTITVDLSPLPSIILRHKLSGADVQNVDTATCQDMTAKVELSIDSTEYIGNFIFENGHADKYLFPGGFYTYASTNTPPSEGTGEVSSFHYYLTDHLGNNRVVVNDNGDIEQTTHYYPFGAIYADAGKNPDFQKFKYTGKELDLTHGLNTYDHGARQNYSILGVWDRVDPMAEKYYNVSPYTVSNNNPLRIIDIDGCEIRGVTRNDAAEVVSDIRSMFNGEEFEKFRSLIVQTGKNHNGKTLERIGDLELSNALDGVELSEDQKALIEIVVNTINSSDIHTIEYVEKNKTISSEGEMAYDLNPKLSAVKEYYGGVPMSLIVNDGGMGLTVRTRKGTHSFIVYSQQDHPYGRAVTVGHEIFGHGRSLVLGRIDTQDIDAIQTENLILRLMGIDYVNDGSRNKVLNPSALPNFR